MNKEQLINFKSKIEKQKKEIEDNQLLYSIYDKVIFIKENFPEGCLINITIYYSSYNSSREKRNRISLMSANVNNEMIVIDSGNLIDKKIDAYLPKNIKPIHNLDSFSVKNTEDGINEFIRKILDDKYELFQSLYISKILKKNDNIKNKLKV